MVEYVLATTVGVILTILVVLLARFLNQSSQHNEKSAARQEEIVQRLDSIRRDVIQVADGIAAELKELRDQQRRLDDAVTALPAADKTAAENLGELNKKLDRIAEQIAEKTYVSAGSTTGGSSASGSFEIDLPGLDKDIEKYVKPYVKGSDVFKGFIKPGPFVKPSPSFGTGFTDRGKTDWKVEIDPDHQVEIPGIAPYIVERVDPSPTWKPSPAPEPPVASPAPPPPPPAVSPPPPVAPQPPEADAASEARRTVDLMFATTRKYDDAQERFTGERSPSITFGQAFVRVPEDRLPGELNRPKTYTLFSFTVYRQKEDPRKHFVLRGASILPKERWLEVIGSMPSGDALVFVHGFNTSFDDALYRNAQIVWDLRFKGLAVLFSWASRGAIADYGYDRNSAQLARGPFVEVLELLAGRPNVQQIHILAHSMGNEVVLDALAHCKSDAAALKLGELVMAAPDVDRDVYKTIAVSARKLTKRMTLYASAADRALLASKVLAGDIPRAGDVPDDGPIVLDSIDSIDATALGEEIFGLNHSTYARSLSILNDVLLLLEGKAPPRVIEINSVPDGAIPPKYWRYLVARS